MRKAGNRKRMGKKIICSVPFCFWVLWPTLYNFLDSHGFILLLFFFTSQATPSEGWSPSPAAAKHLSLCCSAASISIPPRPWPMCSSSTLARATGWATQGHQSPPILANCNGEHAREEITSSERRRTVWEKQKKKEEEEEEEEEN